MGVVQHPGQAVFLHPDGRHHVEPQQGEVGEIVPGERLALEVGVHQAQATQAHLAGTRAAHVGELELVRVADDHRLDVSLAVEEHADLAVGLQRELGQVPGQLGADDLMHGHVAAPGVLQVFELAGLEAQYVASRFVHGASFLPRSTYSVTLCASWKH